ncbi:MAG: archaemetzincin family Zn-dependent metalloprotease [Candidatus Bathyarchaeota archaeon]|nr:archaemetzincin family Zn-dependent metalloprotease [Candidatus Bathyarchaeota archaeon]
MKVGILPISYVDSAILMEISNGLQHAFPNTTCMILPEKLPLKTEYFDEKRQQYRSHALLSAIQKLAAKKHGLHRVLGVVDADLFVPDLNFVFGAALCPGKAALISLWRLRPEFYGEESCARLFYARAFKEAVHELGHTLGLSHCTRTSCVMYFSNSILDTDRKQSLFCEQCYLHVTISIMQLE